MNPHFETRRDARRAASPAGDSAPKTPIPGRAILSKLAAILRQAITPTPDAYDLATREYFSAYDECIHARQQHDTRRMHEAAERLRAANIAMLRLEAGL